MSENKSKFQTTVTSLISKLGHRSKAVKNVRLETKLYVLMCLDYVTMSVDSVVYPVTDGAITLKNKCCTFVNISGTALIKS